MNNRLKRGFATSLCGMMMLSLLSVEPIKVSAAADVKDINIGLYGLDDPKAPETPESGWANDSGNYVYYGTYPQDDITGITKEPILWRVLDSDHDIDGDGSIDGAFLMSDSVLDINSFQTDNSSNVWQDSDLRKWMNSIDGWKGSGMTGGFLNNAFNSAEQTAIANSYITETSTYTYESTNKLNQTSTVTCNPVSVQGDKIFALSYKEAQNSNYGFYPTGYNSNVTNNTLFASNTGYANNKDNSDNMGGYWLRTSVVSNSHYLVGMVDGYNGADNYYVTGLYNNVVTLGAAPAMNLDKDKVLFTMAAGTEKSDFSSVGNTNVNNKWIVTVLDGNDFRASRMAGETGDIVSGATVTVDVTNIPTSINEYTQLSAIIVDEAGAVVAYGKISDKVKTGRIKVIIPDDATGTGKLSLMVFAEDVNSSATNYVTDYASNMVDVTVAPAENPCTVTMEDWIYGDEAKKPVPKSTTNGVDNVTYEYKSADADDDTYTSNVPTAIGKYVVRATFAATPDYLVCTATDEFEIIKQIENSTEATTEATTATTTEAITEVSTVTTSETTTEASTVTPDDNSPATGDTTQSMIILFSLIISGLGILSFLFSYKTNNKIE